MSTTEVLVDMDGVLADAHSGFEVKMAALHPEIESIDTSAYFFPLEGYKAEDHAACWDVLSAPGFFAELPLMDGALDAWECMLNTGLNPRICSKPMNQSPTCREDKFAWLETYFVPRFGAAVMDQAILTHNKATIDAVALIDDNPSIPDADQARWQHIVFGRPYNAHILGQPRLEDWRDNRLGAILLQAQKRYVDEAASDPLAST